MIGMKAKTALHPLFCAENAKSNKLLRNATDCCVTFRYIKAYNTFKYGALPFAVHKNEEEET